MTSFQADYAIGVESHHMWLSIAGDSAGEGFKFYGKTTNVATISGNGNFSCNGGVTCSSLTVNDDLTVSGDVTLTSFLPIKPYASLRVLTSTDAPAVASTGTTEGTIGTPGTVSLTQYGFLTNVSLARGTVATTNLFTYLFTLPTPHPLGANYIVNGSFYTPGSLSPSSPSPNAFLTFNVISSTSFNVWVRTATNILMDGNFHVHTVP
jgi:hypothetical protein